MPQTPVTPTTIDDLLADPSRSVGLTRGAIQQLYIELASRIGTPKLLKVCCYRCSYANRPTATAPLNLPANC
jgi:hypothetical protein